MANSSTADTTSGKSFKLIANLIKLLPTGTVFVFQFLSPLLTNKGQCHTVNKYLTGALLILCGFSCCFSSFTDSYTGSDGKVYYGVLTVNGLYTLLSSSSNTKKELSKYKLKFRDVIHGILSLIVFMVIALLDANIVTCFYPSFELKEKAVIMALPAVVGSISSIIFTVLPSTRHGIGYAASVTSEISSV